MKEIDITFKTMFSELEQRSLDASFATEFSTDGNFVRQTSKGKEFWYFQVRTDGVAHRKYVGPTSDEEITKRVKAFNEIKNDLKSRRQIVSTLTRNAGLPKPENFTGDVVEILGKAGFFRLHGVLVGTVAFQCYPGLLGIKLPIIAMQTGDADFAQFHSVSVAVGDSLPPMLDLLKQLDETFREIPHQNDGRHTTQYENSKRYKVEFLTPNRGSDDLSGHASPMPALGGASAQPLRFLDFLIHEPIRTVMLHKSGVPVTIPAPERFAVHKLIVSTRRRNDASGYSRRDKDLMQAKAIIEALIQTRREGDLAMAFSEAWNRGPSWQEALKVALGTFSKLELGTVADALLLGFRQIGEEPSNYDLA
ncbi:MAG: nucleotidyltransferase family protein [Brucella intermedia]